MRHEHVSSTVGGMPYPLRDELAGCWYHVGTRGNNRRDIYTDASSRLLFLLRLQIVVAYHDWTVAAYCLMTNHYHLVIKVSDSGMSDGMKELNSGYARAFNIRHGRQDHLFGRRFWSRQLADENDLVTTCRYIELNPWRSFGRRPDSWPWSSHRATAGIEVSRKFHAPSAVWGMFGGQPRRAMKAWTSFVAAGLVEP
jgi:putative transposase